MTIHCDSWVLLPKNVKNSCRSQIHRNSVIGEDFEISLFMLFYWPLAFSSLFYFWTDEIVCRAAVAKILAYFVLPFIINQMQAFWCFALFLLFMTFCSLSSLFLLANDVVLHLKQEKWLLTQKLQKRTICSLAFIFNCAFPNFCKFRAVALDVNFFSSV